MKNKTTQKQEELKQKVLKEINYITSLINTNTFIYAFRITKTKNLLIISNENNHKKFILNNNQICLLNNTKDILK